MLYGGGYSFLDASMRLLDFGAIIAFLILAYSRLTSVSSRAWVSWLAGSLASSGIPLPDPRAQHVPFHFMPALRAGGISILWSVFALGLILAGIRHQRGALRYVGLGLFTVVGVKVFFVDLASLDQFYRHHRLHPPGRPGALRAFLYLKYRQTFENPYSQVSEEVKL